MSVMVVVGVVADDGVAEALLGSTGWRSPLLAFTGLTEDGELKQQWQVHADANSDTVL